MNISNINIGRKELAEFFGFTEKYINELVNDHGLPREEHNKYNLIKCFQWFIVYIKENHTAEILRLKREKPQDDLARNSARLKELEILEKEKKLFDSDDVTMAWLNEIKIFGEMLDTICINLAPLLIDKSNEKEIRYLIKQQTDKIKKEIADLQLK
jgi:hypothetical protein